MDKLLSAIVALLSAQTTNNQSPLYGVKKVFYGKPLRVADSDTPGIIVHPVDTSYSKRGTRYDQKEHSIEIRLVLDQRAGWKNDQTNADTSKVALMSRAIEMVEGLGTSSLTTKNTTIVGVIQTNASLPLAGVPTCAESGVERIDYRENTEGDFPTLEVVISVRAVVVADRFS